MNKKTIQSLSFLFLTIVLSACTQNKKNETKITKKTQESLASATIQVKKSSPEKRATKKLNIHLELNDGTYHWMPKEIYVKRGENVEFNVSHDVEAGKSFHGFSIAKLGIAKQVNRGKKLQLFIKIPEDLEKGTHDISCQFHPAHKGSTLIVQ